MKVNKTHGPGKNFPGFLKKLSIRSVNRYRSYLRNLYQLETFICLETCSCNNNLITGQNTTRQLSIFIEFYILVVNVSLNSNIIYSWNLQLFYYQQYWREKMPEIKEQYYVFDIVWQQFFTNPVKTVTSTCHILSIDCYLIFYFDVIKSFEYI